jgi:class 3 adenylate cyclase
MERLESFVAGALLQRLQPSDAGDSAPACSIFAGAVLFVDISGYTALAETLCGQGPQGIEQLGKTLDLAFRGHVRAVHDTGGEIACFAGDAFIAYWPADDGSVPRALSRAHACARLLHLPSQSAAPSSSIATPRLHIGLGSGQMWAARLGADERWQLLLAGPAVRDACTACTRAAAGQTVVAPDADLFIASSSEVAAGAKVAGDSANLRSAFSAPDLATHVPKRVQEYVGEGYAAWIPQRRTICALFIKIVGLDDAAPDALSRHQAVVTSLHTALRPYTGSTGTLLRDDKGLVFTLCFGMPHDTHADDALRAVRAGLAARSELARLGFDCAIGVAAGPGVCMPLGGPHRRHYWPVGRFMHVAGRLMEAAGSGLLCTDEVADRVRRAVGLSPERPLTLRGVKWPVRPFRVREDERIEDHTEVLFGREDEQGKLDRCLNTFEEGRGTVLWIEGQAGLGKSALIHYLRQAALHRGIEVLAGGAGSVEMAVAYAAWRPVFAKLLHGPSADSASSVHRAAQLSTISHPQLAPLINAVVPGFLEETPVVKNLSGQARADATSSVLSDAIAVHASRRFVLVLEDCHWMDSASWRLVLRVAQDHSRALIVLTSRPSVDVIELSALKRLEQFTAMNLSPLRSDAIEAVVSSILGERSADQVLVEEITQRSVGNPLFAREYALLLTTNLHQRDFESTSHSPSPDGNAIPVTVQGMIASRLDALSAAEDLALKSASVIGDRFSVELIARVYPGGTRGDILDVALDQLAKRQLVVRDENVDGCFAFPHAMIREVTYGQLTLDQRRELHRRAAVAIEQMYHDDLRPHFAALAHHWSQAGVPSATVRYADLAASQALLAGAFEEADRLLTTCMQLASGADLEIPIADRIRWHREAADARSGMGQLESRSAAAHQALRLAGVPRSHSSAGLIAQAAGRFCALKVRRVVPRSWQPSVTPETLDVALAYRHSAEVCYFNNDMLGMICDSASAVASASSLGPSAVLAGASTELGGILSVAGLRRIGERMLQSAIAAAEAAGDHGAQAHAHMVSCLYFVGIGDWLSAERSAKRCQELCEPMDDRVNWTNAQAVRFWMSHYRSRDAAAYDAARSLRDRASETGNRQHRAWAFRFLALCALRNDKPQEAIAHLQAGLECLEETAALNERLPTLGILALAQLKSGDIWSARATAREGLAQSLGTRRPIGHSTLEGHSALVTVALDAWREEQSPQWRLAIRRCMRVLRRYSKSFPVGIPRYQLHLGDYQRLSGSIRAARRSYRRGEAAASRLGMPWECKRCQEALNDLTPQS